MKEIFSENSPENVYNADESGIYYKMLSQKTFCLKTEVVRGQKSKKDRLSVLICANISETDKLVPIVIGNL